MKEIDEFETEIKNTLELKIETIEFTSYKLLYDLNMEKGLEIERIKKTVINLEKLKIPKTIVDTTRKSIIPKKYLCHILRHKIYCA